MIKNTLARFSNTATEQAMIRVYLAGKVYPHTRSGSIDWRSTLALGKTPFGYEIEKSGPYFVSCDHSCFHGNNSHGRGANTLGNCYGVDDESDKHEGDSTPHEVVQKCLTWIKDSDALFAWIDKDDAYGTLVEVGIAVAIGKPVFIATPSKFESDCDGEITKTNKPSDMWFAKELSDMSITAESPSAAWEIFRVLVDRLVEKCKKEQKWEKFL